MALTNTFTRYDAIGLREELSDTIYDISPMDTPFVSMAAKTRCKQTYFEWQTDELAAPVDDNQRVEGFDVSEFSETAPTTRVGNHTQISSKDLILSGTLEVVDKAGRRSELAYQLAKRGREIKRDMETNALANVGGSAGSTSAPRRTATMGAWLKTNVNFGPGDSTPGSNPTYTSGLPGDPRGDADETRPFTEEIHKDVIEQIWRSGGRLHTLLVGGYNKQVVSEFSGIVTRNFDQSNVEPSPTAIIAAADVYVSDFGTLRVVADRFQRERDAWYLDPEYLAMPHLRPFFQKQLADTGDSHKRLLIVEYGLKVKQEAALGLAADLDEEPAE